jgi:O-antigen ligase
MASAFQKMTTYFRQNVWLFPLLLLCLSYLGRGVSNTLALLFVIWGLLSIRGNVLREYKGILSIYALLIASFALSTHLGGGFDIGAKQWLVFTLYSLVLIFVLSGELDPKDFRFNNIILVFLLIPFVIFPGKIIYLIADGHIQSRAIVGTMIPAIIAPFFLLYFYELDAQRNLGRFFLVSLLVFVLLLAGDSRTEPFMFLSAVISMFVFINKRLKLLLLIPLSLVIVIVLFSIIGRGNSPIDSTTELTLNNLSSQRLDIWKLVVNNPPENVLLGSGINNTMQFLPANPLNSAFHNAFLEIWYETGFLGIGLWLLLFIVLLKNIHKVYFQSKGRHRIYYAAFLGSLVAVIIAGMLDKGYMSVFYKFFIFYLGAMLYILGQPKTFEQFATNESEKS